MGQSYSYSTFEQDNHEMEAPISTGVTVNDNPGNINVTIREDGNSFEEQKGSRITGDDLCKYEASDWRATARNPNGGFRTNDITAASIVEIDGVSAPISTFLQIGAMVKDGDGFALAGQTQDPTNGADQRQEANPDTATLDAAQERAALEALAPISQSTFDSCIASGAALVTNEMNFEDIVAKVSTQTGLDPDDAAQRIGVVRDTYQAQADAFITKAGVHPDDLEDFYNWCRGAGNKNVLKEAVQKQLYERDMSGYRKLIKGFDAATPPSVQTLKDRDFPTRTLRGVDEVRVNGQWLSIKSAAKAGIF